MKLVFYRKQVDYRCALKHLEGRAKHFISRAKRTATVALQRQYALTSEDIGNLPRWAAVALAARCAMRVMPWYRPRRGSGPKQTAVEFSAIEFCGIFALKAALEGRPCDISVAETLKLQLTTAMFEWQVVRKAPFFAGQTAIDAVLSATADSATAATQATLRALAAHTHAVACSNYPGSEVADELRFANPTYVAAPSDYRGLLDLKLGLGGEDGRPVPATFFEVPLWPPEFANSPSWRRVAYDWKEILTGIGLTDILERHADMLRGSKIDCKAIAQRLNTWSSEQMEGTIPGGSRVELTEGNTKPDRAPVDLHPRRWCTLPYDQEQPLRREVYVFLAVFSLAWVLALVMLKDYGFLDWLSTLSVGVLGSAISVIVRPLRRTRNDPNTLMRRFRAGIWERFFEHPRLLLRCTLLLVLMFTGLLTFYAYRPPLKFRIQLKNSGGANVPAQAILTIADFSQEQETNHDGLCDLELPGLNPGTLSVSKVTRKEDGQTLTLKQQTYRTTWLFTHRIRWFHNPLTIVVDEATKLKQTEPSSADRHTVGEDQAGNLKEGPARVSVRPLQVVLHEFDVVFYNGANDPELFVNGKPSRPMKYSSGIATFRLAAGSYTIRADYPSRTCSATVSVPHSEPVAATCNLK